ncbi:MAG: hypothetical protein EBU79_14355, partial [Betaproteobacteria bacterium]|nr:hypothetical protein [Betaproteobacteria bacterium]
VLQHPNSLDRFLPNGAVESQCDKISIYSIPTMLSLISSKTLLSKMTCPNPSRTSWLQWQAMAATPWLRAFHVLWVILAAAGLYFISLRILGVHLMRLIKR